uniref:Uncharacterized protein n=1 Tax=Sphaeramia orbicularis TaxID=375764 RepID=A0A673BDG7_9TELE
MAACLDLTKPFSAELHVIRRLNNTLSRPGVRDGLKPAERSALAPLRCDIPLLDPCCGHLSAGAEVNLGIKGRQTFIDIPHVASALWVPPGFRERPQTSPRPHGSLCEDLSEDKAWSSRKVPESALRARINGKNTTYM